MRIFIFYIIKNYEKVNFVNLRKINNQILKNNRNKIFKTILSGVYTNSKEVKDFEIKYSKYEGFKHCVAVNSGTSALHLALESLKLKKNSHILTPSHTFLATISSIEYAGHKPIFIDIDKDSLNMDIKKLKNSILKKLKLLLQ